MEKTPSKLVDSLSQMEKRSALLLRPKRRSTAKQTVKACAAQQGVSRCAHAHEHIGKSQFVKQKDSLIQTVLIVTSDTV